jgi:hypothetical protein
MRAIRTIAITAALGLGLMAGGCSTLQNIVSGIELTTKSVSNPVTPTDEVKIELGMDTAIQALIAYKQACLAGAADKNCRSNITQIQAYTRNIPALVAQLRNFVDTNNQVSAAVVYNQLLALYNNIKPFAATAGVTMGDLS